MNQHPPFPQFDPVSIENYKTGATYYLMRADQVEVSDRFLRQIQRLCNEPDIYHWLFRRLLKGQPYSLDMARGFFAEARKAWAENERYVFVIVTEAGDPAACVDIKSADREAAEIGYWCGREHKGLMTNAVRQLCQLARSAGFRQLWAQTERGNQSSARVLERAGFIENQRFSKDPDVYDAYSKTFPEA